MVAHSESEVQNASGTPSFTFERAFIQVYCSLVEFTLCTGT
jgi:hypothetical protein